MWAPQACGVQVTLDQCWGRGGPTPRSQKSRITRRPQRPLLALEGGPGDIARAVTQLTLCPSRARAVFLQEGDGGGGTVLSRRASGGEDTRGVRADGAVRPCVARGAYFFLDCRAVVLFAVTVIVTYFFRALYSLAVCLQKRAPCALAVSAGGGLPSGPGSRGRGRGPRGGSRCPPRRRGLRGRPWGS